MNYTNVLGRLAGIIPFIPTPFKSAGSLFTELDEAGLRKNLQFLMQFPFSCISPTAGTGDLMTLSDDEYHSILNITMEEVGQRFLIMPGLPQETERAMRLARDVQAMGYECLLSFPPPALNLSEAGLCAHWRAISQAVDIPIIIFRASWIPFSMQVLEDLKDVQNIIAVKEETGDLLWFKNARRSYSDRYAFIGGGELQFLNYLLAGANAITTGLPNFMPRPFFSMFAYAMNNDYRKANALHEKLLPLLQIRQKQGNPIPLLKYSMDQVGLVGGTNRLPQIDLSEEDKKIVRQYLTELAINDCN